MQDMDRNLQENVAHLLKVVDELSDVLARHANEIELLKRRQEMLMQREAEREQAEGGGVQLGDQPPPHW